MVEEIAQHRSVRDYSDRPVEKEVLNELLRAATRASNTGNMQLYSIVVTSELELRSQLAPLHFNQAMVTQAPLTITFCADINRFSKWCRLRGAEPQYDNFVWFMNAATDALLASQNMAVEAQAHGLGICYLGTTTYNAAEISAVLKLPKGVAPVTTLIVGYPARATQLTDRLPMEAVVHDQTYHDYTDQEIEKIWEEREASNETAGLLKVNDLPNLARIFTDRRYRGGDNVAFSRKYFDFLTTQGFFNQ